MPPREIERYHKVKDEKRLQVIYGSEGQRLCEYFLNGLTERGRISMCCFSLGKSEAVLTCKSSYS